MSLCINAKTGSEWSVFSGPKKRYASSEWDVINHFLFVVYWRADKTDNFFYALAFVYVFSVWMAACWSGCISPPSSPWWTSRALVISVGEVNKLHPPHLITSPNYPDKSPLVSVYVCVCACCSRFYRHKQSSKSTQEHERVHSWQRHTHTECTDIKQWRNRSIASLCPWLHGRQQKRYLKSKELSEAGENREEEVKSLLVWPCWDLSSAEIFPQIGRG